MSMSFQNISIKIGTAISTHVTPAKHDTGKLDPCIINKPSKIRKSSI